MSAVSKTFFAALVSTAAHHDVVGVQGVKLRMEQINGGAPNQPEEDQQEDSAESIEDMPEMPPQVEQDALEWAKNGQKMNVWKTELGFQLHLMEATGDSEELGMYMTQETERLILIPLLTKYHVDFEGKNWNFADKVIIYCRIKFLEAELQRLGWDLEEDIDEDDTFQDLEEMFFAANNAPFGGALPRMEEIEITH